MATITISLTGSAITGLTGNPSKSYTVSDADLQALLTWAAGNFNLPGNAPNSQILLAWIQDWVSRTIHAVQVANTASPPPISIQ